MLRKKTRTLQKDQNTANFPMSASGLNSFLHFDVVAQIHRINSFFSVPGLLIGLNPKGLSDGDSLRSPTSPLDFRVFPSPGNSFRSQRSWDSDKVGLSIVESLGENANLSPEAHQPSDAKNIVFGRQMMIRAPNLACSSESSKHQLRNSAISSRVESKASNLQTGNSNSLLQIVEDPLKLGPTFGMFRSFSLDSSQKFLSLKSHGSSNLNSTLGTNRLSWESKAAHGSAPPQLTGVSKKESNFVQICSDIGSVPIGSLSANEIELSEDYTCVITHGANSKTTRIFCDCILESHYNDLTNSSDLTNLTVKQEQRNGVTQMPSCPGIFLPHLSNDFLSFCNSCKKKLEGKDVFMYRGEKAFCSSDCRDSEIVDEEEVEETVSTMHSPRENCKEEPAGGIFFIG